MNKPTTAAMFVCALSVSIGAATIVGCSPSPESDRSCQGDDNEVRTCAKGATLTGIDVSFYQGDVNWTKVKGANRTFAFARVSDGTNNPDSKFAKNWPGMRKAGLVRGAYQFFRPAQDAKAQAKLLLDKIGAAGGLGPGDLPPVLDIETADGQSAKVVQSRAKIWLDAVEKAVGKKPIVYTGANMSSVIGKSLSTYTLWVANYGASCPQMPDGWSNWHFWQNSDRGKVAGVAGGVDTNFFNGTLAQLTALTLKGPGAGGSDAGGIPDAGGPEPEVTDAGGLEDAGPGDIDAGANPEEPPAPAEPVSETSSQGATLGSAGKEPATMPGQAEQAASGDPCGNK